MTRADFPELTRYHVICQGQEVIHDGTAASPESMALQHHKMRVDKTGIEHQGVYMVRRNTSRRASIECPPPMWRLYYVSLLSDQSPPRYQVSEVVPTRDFRLDSISGVQPKKTSPSKNKAPIDGMKRTSSRITLPRTNKE